MKHYAMYILLLMLSSCRSSSSSLDTSIRNESEIYQEKVSKETIEEEKLYNETSSSSSNTQIDEFTRTTKYNSDGSISEIQEQTRTIGRNELADSSRSESDVSGIVRNDSIDTHSKTKIDFNELRESKGDSRAVQGIEWLYIALVGGVLLLVILAFIYRHYQK